MSYEDRFTFRTVGVVIEFDSPQVKSGETSLFWHDRWVNQPLSVVAPELYSFAKNKQISVHKAFNENEIANLFQLPLSQPAFLQMQEIHQIMQSHPLNDSDDRWIYSWGSNNFASAKVYRILVGHENVHIIYKWLWKSQCQPKHKVFFWLLIKDRLSTRNLLRRRNMNLDSYNCVLCNMLVNESVHHLFVDCSFARMCWDILNVDIPLNGSFLDLASELKVQLNTQFFMGAIILLCWTIWTARNHF